MLKTQSPATDPTASSYQLEKEIDQGERQLKMMLSTIQILENRLRNNPDRKSQQTLEDMQDEALKQTRYVEELKAQLSKTRDTAEKFKSTCRCRCTNKNLDGTVKTDQSWTLETSPR